MKLLVCGGRDYHDYETAKAVLDSIHQENRITTIIHGEADGADTLADRWAKEMRISRHTFPAQWEDFSEPCKIRFRGGKKYNALAGFNRNQRMLEEGRPDCGLALPGGSGTADMADRLARAGIEVLYI